MKVVKITISGLSYLFATLVVFFFIKHGQGSIVAVLCFGLISYFAYKTVVLTVEFARSLKRGNVFTVVNIFVLTSILFLFTLYGAFYYALNKFLNVISFGLYVF